MRIGDAWENFRVSRMYDRTQSLVWFYWACCYLIVGCANTIVSSPRWILMNIKEVKRWTEKHVRLNDILEWRRHNANNNKQQMSAQCAKFIPNIFCHKIRGCFLRTANYSGIKKRCENFVWCVINSYKLHIFMYKSSICNL